MKVTLEKKEKNNVHLEVEVDIDKVKRAIDHAYKQVSQQVNIPGFRKGKAPRQLVERAVGTDYIKREALEKLIPEALELAVAEQALEVIERPDVEIIKFEISEPLIFKATVPVRPEVEFEGKYTDVSAQAPKTELDPESIETKLTEMREQKSALVAVEQAIEEGNFAIIDFSGKLKDAESPFEGGTAEDFKAEIAPGRFIDGFMENLVGMKAGEEKDFEVTFPAEYHVKDLAGQPATFHVKVKEVQAKKVPDLDDVFAASMGDFNTVADLRANVEKDLTEEAEDNREVLLRQQILDQVLEKAVVELPDSMIQREIEFLMRQYAQVMQAQGMNVDNMFTPQRMAEWRNNLRDEAVKRIKTSLTLGTVAKEQGITITNEEVDEEIVQYAAMYKVDPTAVREQLISTGGWSTLADEVLSNKILDWLREQATVTEGPIPAQYAPKPEGDAIEAETEEVGESDSAKKPKKIAAAKKKKSDEAVEGDDDSTAEAAEATEETPVAPVVES